MAAWPEPVERVAAVLRDRAVESRLEEFPEGTPTASAAARAVGCDLPQIVKSLVFVCDGAMGARARAGAIAAPTRRRWRPPRCPRGARVARPEEVVDATGFEPGAVAPFPLRGSSAS